MHGSLARKLRVLRAERGLSVREVEAISGVAKETVSQIERGERHPLDRTLAKLARVYDVPLDDLLEEPVQSGKGLASPETGPAIEVSDIEELRQIARDLKAEWTRIGVEIHDRAVASDLPREEHLRMDRRMVEIEGTILAVRKRAQALREKLDKYEAEGVFELTAS
jgi:transcriptional regulator with XRE-family HTH domain